MRGVKWTLIDELEAIKRATRIEDVHARLDRLIVWQRTAVSERIQKMIAKRKQTAERNRVAVHEIARTLPGDMDRNEQIRVISEELNMDARTVGFHLDNNT